MGNFTEYLKQILSARYGKDVRQSIHDGMKETHDIATDARNSATAAASTATAKANEAVAASNTATTKAKEAIEAAEQARIYADNAGTNIVRTTTPTLYNSHAGGINLNGLGGVSEQETTSGAQLLDMSKAVGGTHAGLTATINVDGSYNIVGTAENENINIWLLGGYNSTVPVITLDAGTYYIKGVNLYPGGSSVAGAIITYDNEGTIFTLEETKSYCAVRVSSTVVGAVRNETIYPIIAKSIVPVEWEPYTGRQPSPSPEFSSEIKRVKGKNLLDCRGLVEQTINGVTFTPVYDDNDNILYVEANGTSNGGSVYVLRNLPNLDNDKYIINGCPRGGGTSSYRMQFYNHDGNSGMVHDVGSEVSFDFTNESGEHNVAITIFSGYTADHLRFYPMIRKASIADPTYVPYGLLRIKGHGKNWLPNVATEQNVNGIDFTLLEEGRIKANGMATADAVLIVNNRYGVTKDTISLKNDAYILSGCPAGGSANTYRLQVWNYMGDNATAAMDVGSGVKFDFTNENDVGGTYNVAIVIKAGVTVNDIIFEPMIRKADITDDTYEPYTEQSIILSKPIELNGIGDVEDGLIQKDGAWNKNPKFESIKLPSSWGWYINPNSTVGSNGIGCFQAIADSGVCANSNEYEATNMMCTHFPISPSANIYTNTNRIENSISAHKNASGTTTIRLRNTNCTTLEEFKTWLDENEVYVTYELAEPTIEELPTADQIALHSLMSYDGVTYLYCDSEIQPTWDLEYGTSKVGAYTLDAWNTAKRTEIKQEAKYNEVVSALLALNQE